MKRQFLLLLICCGFSTLSLTAQRADSTTFEFSYVPTSTDSYKYIVTRTKVELTKRSLEIKRNRDKGKEIMSSYIRQFSIDEMNTLNSIISAYKLDSAGLYNKKTPQQWGMVWKVKIFTNSVPYELDLPNYHNKGLEMLLVFINKLIPDKEQSPFAYIADENRIVQ